MASLRMRGNREQEKSTGDMPKNEREPRIKGYEGVRGVKI